MNAAQQNTNRPRRRQDGFTLIEMALVLVIIGLVASTIAGVALFARTVQDVTGLDFYSSSQRFLETKKSLDRSESAIAAYYGIYRSLPCPADPTLDPTDANFGRESRDAGGNCIIAGITEADGFRDADNIDGDNFADTDRDKILIGAFPVMSLIDPDNDPATPDGVLAFNESGGELRNTHGIDGWDNKITYAVSKNLTHPSTYNQSYGVIEVHTEDATQSLLNQIEVNYSTDPVGSPPREIGGTAHYVLVSHGENGKGGYSLNGALIENCAYTIGGVPTVPPVGTPDNEIDNCDGDGDFINGQYSPVDGRYYDDTIFYSVGATERLWQNIGATYVPGSNPTPDPNDDYVKQIVNANGGNIGIGYSVEFDYDHNMDGDTNDIGDGETLSERLEINGDIKANKFEAEALCDPTKSLCMPVEVISGELTDMTCANNGEVVVKIENNKVFCASPFDPSDFGPCPAGQFVVGLSSSTGPICQ